MRAPVNIFIQSTNVESHFSFTVHHVDEQLKESW